LAGPASFFRLSQQFESAPGGIVIAARSQLRVRQPELAIPGRFAPHGHKLSGRTLRGVLRTGSWSDPVIGHLLVRNVAGRRPGHVTGCAIGIFRVVLACELPPVVTLKALLPVED